MPTCLPPALSGAAGPGAWPLAFHLTGGAAHDSPQLPLLPGLGPDVTPRAILTDKGHDAKSNRAAARAKGIMPVIPVRKRTARSPKHFPKTLYKGRARIEQAVGKLKRFKRIALRCEKTVADFLSLVSFACGLILVKPVHTT